MSEHTLNIVVAVLLIIVSIHGFFLLTANVRLRRENQQLRDDIITAEEARLRRLEDEGRIRTRA